jgi:hypothetical protein
MRGRIRKERLPCPLWANEPRCKSAPQQKGNGKMDTKMMQLVAVIDKQVGETKKGYWTRIGVAFENTDGSWNLRFDYLPTRADTTIQMRPFQPKREEAETE